MTKKPSHLHHVDEPQELEGPRADISGKEPVLVRDWDESSLVTAIHEGQFDLIPQIIDDELDHLLKSPYWQQTRDEPYEHIFDRVPNDLITKTLDMCHLDSIPVHRTVTTTMPWSNNLEQQIETRFHDLTERIQHSGDDDRDDEWSAYPGLDSLFRKNEVDSGG